MKKNLGFRGWYYFRTGWATYFAFILAAVNTLVVTYYLAIENLPILQQLFPSFTHYVITAVIIGIPTLTITGYMHFKKSHAYKSEADIAIEANPHMRRLLLNTEVILQSNNYFEIDSHINCHDSVDHFIDTLPLNDVLYSGTKPWKDEYDRFLVIGI